MPMIEKEVISPGTHWYRDEATGEPRKLVVTPELTNYWHEQGNKMLGLGLTVPVPCEHDFQAHPMTPADKLKNNAGWIKNYVMRGDKLFAALDIQDVEIANKLPKTIRWTSPWISSFTDGQGRDWKNVISHLALTTRPRIIKQAPFGSIAAALSVATPPRAAIADAAGYCLSRAGRLVAKDGGLFPEYPVAFSLYGGVKLGGDEFPDDKRKPDDNPTPGESDAKPDSKPSKMDPEGDDDIPKKSGASDNPLDALGDMDGDLPPPDAAGAPGAADSMPLTELLSQLLPMIGVQMPDARFLTSETFMKELCTAMMTKLTQMVAATQQQPAQPPAPQPQPAQPRNPGQPNPLIQQEQPPMYMSLEEIHKLEDPVLKNVALSMYGETQKQAAANVLLTSQLNSLRDKALAEESAKRRTRVERLKRMSPSLRADLDALTASPSMALSMGDAGAVVDPMAQTLAMLEKGLSDMPRLLTAESNQLLSVAHPTDGEQLSAEAADKISDDLSRMMGCPPEKKAG